MTFLRQRSDSNGSDTRGGAALKQADWADVFSGIQFAACCSNSRLLSASPFAPTIL